MRVCKIAAHGVGAVRVAERCRVKQKSMNASCQGLRAIGTHAEDTTYRILLSAAPYILRASIVSLFSSDRTSTSETNRTDFEGSNEHAPDTLSSARYLEIATALR